MREENSLFEEELQQEENLPVADPIEEQPQEVPAENLPAAEDQPLNELEEASQETEDQPLEGTEEDAPETEEIPQEIPAEDVPAAETQGKASESAAEAEAQGEASAPAEEANLPPEARVLPYHERYYLKYREGKRSTPLDLEGTRAFLQELGFDGGELRQARAGKDCAESFRNSDKNKNNQMYCSYCGSEIAGVEYFRLPDGRLRCTTCSSTVVKTKAEIEELLQRVITNLDNFFGATIDVPISIQVTEHRKLKKKIGVPLGTRDSQSMLILGVAINKKKKYSIILENGAPRLSLIATFAHELTNIWQYAHWDNNRALKKCARSKRLLIYEGMAKWAEIQYLYLIGETNVAKREEYITRNRQDEYGIGFCIYEDQYPLSREAMSCENTPFTPDRYPLE